MALFTFVLLLHFFNYTLADTCVNNNVPNSITWQKELFKELKFGYDAIQAPNDTTAEVIFTMITFNFNSEKEIMAMQTVMDAKWTDERLKWNPEMHHGIEKADISHLFIWSPDFGLSSQGEFNHFSEMAVLYRYDLKSSGEVTIAKMMVQDTKCTVRLTDWPYDVQECTYQFGPTNPYSDGNYSINYHFTVVESSSAEWYIYDYKYVRDNSTKKNVKVTFYLMREAVGLAAIVIYPAFILAVLSILPLCLDVRRQVRLLISCFSLFCHYNLFSELVYDIQNQCHSPPTLLRYYSVSVVLTVVVIILTLVLTEVCKWKSSPQNCIKTINDFVYDNDFRSYFVFPRWDWDDAADDSNSIKDWQKFANFVNSIFLFAIVLAYIGLYSTNIPKPKQHNDEYHYSMFSDIK